MTVRHLISIGGAARQSALDGAQPTRPDAFSLSLLREGLIRPEQPTSAVPQRPQAIGQAEPTALHHSGFHPHGTLAEKDLLAAAARHFGACTIDPVQEPPEASAIDRLGTDFCQRHGILPWRRIGGVTVVLTARPEIFTRLRQVIEGRLGPVMMALAPSTQIAAALNLMRGPQIAHSAGMRVAAELSCRNWGGRALQLRAATLVALALVAITNFPIVSGLSILFFVFVAMAASTVFKIICAVTTLRRPPVCDHKTVPGPLPKVSILVALYRESDIAPRLVRRLSRLDYPRDLLEVVLAVEEEDSLTREALQSAGLPAWMQIVVVPPGRIKTKPRALNVALDHCHGAIIGVYDAEDAPEPDQIRRVVARFRQSDSSLACLQGVLDYYNPATNWIARMFTIEYAAWFRLILPGVARLGLMVPLGGTTLFFRRDVLEELGAWDAHNVTEDADLGIRLARKGYRTALMTTVTREEANCRPLAWIRQRSRWIKGHMMTWIVHMRHPRRLWREVGTPAFIGFQVMFLGAALQTLLAPLLWSFWLIAFGLPHPLAEALPQGVMMVLLTTFILAAVVDFTLGILALRQAGHRISKLWVFTLHFYQPLATFAGFKALWELITHPFYWDKTSHGLFDQTESPPNRKKS
ncbi:glycosyltransferase [Xinfangfangia sp. D13-10-4-6]|uniref:glycosyltransferase n=1 Tax=Pseudogemmobacter hezensis TaxID=2737662 RepID=UPI001554EAE3|nr:glycosyltransferase [Pseudogemmobacter hezensis]NPD16240.1 glycosyltransferase [Pseudogemmobacter hezensis]